MFFGAISFCWFDSFFNCLMFYFIIFFSFVPDGFASAALFRSRFRQELAAADERRRDEKRHSDSVLHAVPSTLSAKRRSEEKWRRRRKGVLFLKSETNVWVLQPRKKERKNSIREQQEENTRLGYTIDCFGFIFFSSFPIFLLCSFPIVLRTVSSCHANESERWLPAGQLAVEARLYFFAGPLSRSRSFQRQLLDDKVSTRKRRLRRQRRA